MGVPPPWPGPPRSRRRGARWPTRHVPVPAAALRRGQWPRTPPCRHCRGRLPRGSSRGLSPPPTTWWWPPRDRYDALVRSSIVSGADPAQDRHRRRGNDAAMRRTPWDAFGVYQAAAAAKVAGVNQCEGVLASPMLLCAAPSCSLAGPRPAVGPGARAVAPGGVFVGGAVDRRLHHPAFRPGPPPAFHLASLRLPRIDRACRGSAPADLSASPRLTLDAVVTWARKDNR